MLKPGQVQCGGPEGTSMLWQQGPDAPALGPQRGAEGQLRQVPVQGAHASLAALSPSHYWCEGCLPCGCVVGWAVGFNEQHRPRNTC